MDVKAEVFKRLDALGEKLGVAATHLWEVMVRQGVATGIADAVTAVLLLIIALVASTLARKWFSKGDKDHGSDWLLGWSVAAWFVTFFSTLSCFFYAYDAVLELVNPEFFALKTLMEALK